MHVGVGGRDVKNGSSGSSQGRFATAARFSWSASNHIFVLFLSCRLPDCLPAAPRMKNALGPGLLTKDVAGRQAGSPVSVWQGQISVSFLVRDAGFEGDVSGGCSRGLDCQTVQSLPPSEDSRPTMGITGSSKGRDLPAGS